jgi:hypothetical protein
MLGALAIPSLPQRAELFNYTTSLSVCQAIFSKKLHKNGSRNLCNLTIDFWVRVCYSIIKRWGYGETASRASADLTKPTGFRNKHSLPPQGTKEKRGNKNDYFYNYPYLFNNDSCDEFY